MFEFRDLFQWDRFITPSIIKIFYWLAVAMAVLFGLSGLFSGIGLIMVSPIGGVAVVIASLIGTLAGIIFARIAAEFILIMFRMNEHLGAMRNRGEM